MSVETEEQRAKRRAKRGLFDDAAHLYDASRRGYPAAIVDFMVEAAHVRPGDPVLEIGCGTGQLTRQLAPFGFALTAIDIGTSMVTLARRHVGDSSTKFETVSFEDFSAPDDAFALVVSATAFHWVDPEIGWRKVARLLRPGGWLALLATGEKYDEPLGRELLNLWIECSSDGGAWAREKKPALPEVIRSTGLFGEALERTHDERLTLDAKVIADLEHTRATSLSYDAKTRERFDRGLDGLLKNLDDVSLVQHTTLTMVEVLSDNDHAATSRVSG